MRTTHVKNEVDDEEVDDEEVEENHASRSRVGECLLQDGDEEPLERVLAVVRSGIITRDGGGEREIRCIRVMHFGVGGMRILSIPLLSRNGRGERRCIQGGTRVLYLVQQVLDLLFVFDVFQL